MKKKRNRGLRFFPLSKLMKARRDAQKYKRLAKEACMFGTRARALERIAECKKNYFASLAEWLTEYPLYAESMDDLQQWRERYQTFRQHQWAKCQQKKKDLSTVCFTFDGKSRSFKVTE